MCIQFFLEILSTLLFGKNEKNEKNWKNHSQYWKILAKIEIIPLILFTIDIQWE